MEVVTNQTNQTNQTNDQITKVIGLLVRLVLTSVLSATV